MAVSHVRNTDGETYPQAGTIAGAVQSQNVPLHPMQL